MDYPVPKVNICEAENIVCFHARMCMHDCLSECMHASLSVCMCVSLCVRVCVCLCEYACVCVLRSRVSHASFLGEVT